MMKIIIVTPVSTLGKLPKTTTSNRFGWYTG